MNNSIDLGLGAQVLDAQQNGKFKVSTIRNIAKTAPYAHNGFFTTLEMITSFYNTRDRDPGPWSATEAEVPSTKNDTELGNLDLSPQQEKELNAFMRTLTDGYF